MEEYPPIAIVEGEFCLLLESRLDPPIPPDVVREELDNDGL